MTVTWIIVGSITAVLLALISLRQFAALARDRRKAVGAAEFSRAESDYSLVQQADDLLLRTRLGKWLTKELDLAGLSHRPSVVLAGGVVASIAVTYLVSRFISSTLAALGIAAGALLVRRYLRRAQARRREAFIGQLPELARVLANASHAGLSLATAVGIASNELTEPAKTELGRVSTRLNFGAPLQTAIQELNDRVGSRETNVLMSTLIVASRSGGSLVTALRDIAETLDQRKETRREVTTILSQSVASSNLVVVMGFAILLLLNVMEPGTVERMTRETIGQVSLSIGLGLFAVGLFAIRRMTRIDL